MAKLDAESHSLTLAGSCDCNKTRRQIMEASGRLPAVVDEVTTMPVPLQALARQIVARELQDSGHQAYAGAARAIRRAFKAAFGGRWSCALGLEKHFGLGFSRQAYSCFSATFGKLWVVLFKYPDS